ncbi:alpha/beta hydrolase [Streptomyces sp. DSM 40750]|uniref:alpha/beta hydrolase n=1 Tax=Streptomyces sp. DSM 40750 TaxID=2801030 RepID=UPI00214CF158|nr:alpha/beta hydrolase [Streptomyces sp. DSM 40750]UUU24444.1 alpha/beta hydrolase fold domain-containing protein [Streptomyces sp. DSM 40750]
MPLEGQVAVRRLWGCLVLCAAAVAALLVADSHDSAAADRNEATHSYGAHTRQTLDAYWNAAGEEMDGKQPGIVILHGGHWYRDTGWATWSRTFADAGYAVFDVDYRLNFDAPWPAQRTDALSALDWIRDHATDFDLDTNRLVLLGSSSGGQIATTVATLGSGAFRVDGVVALSPVNSPYRAWQDGNAATATDRQRRLRDNAAILARCSPDAADNDTSAHPGCQDTWKDMTAKSRASGGDDAPMYLLHSAGDFVPVQHSLELEAAEETDHNMPANGVTVETVTGSSHGGALLDEPEVADRVLSWIAERTY